MDTQHHRRRWTRRGQIVPLFAITLFILIAALLFGIDASRLRAEAESAQRAANAAALAGVVYLPNFSNSAFTRAREEARKNGYVTNAARNVTVTSALVPGTSYQLRVTVSEPFQLLFGKLFGLGKIMISRTATAEYLPALQMGSPDYVLGYPGFPSYLTAARSQQNFYLNQNGPYTLKENGDPYSPFFESFNGQGYKASVASDTNPCSNGSSAGNGTTCPGDGVTANAVTDDGSHLSGGTNFDGYKYIISVPTTTTVLVKLFNPFNEINYDANAFCWDNGKLGALHPGDTEAPPQYNSAKVRYGCSTTPITPTVSVPPNLAPQDNRPTDQANTCILGVQDGVCRNEMPDSLLSTIFGSYPDTLYPTTLQFDLTGPSQSLVDPALKTTAILTTPSTAGDPTCATTNCVITPGFRAGADPTECDTITCTTSPVAFKLVNYAVLHGPGYFQLNVKSVVNGDSTSSFGESNSAYGIALCNAISDTTYTANSTPLGDARTNTYVTSSPITTSISSNVLHGWNDAACPSPNGPNCPDPRVAPPGSCTQIFAEGKLPLFNYLSAGPSLIPLGFIPADYKGKTIHVDLYDPGDVDSIPITSSAQLAPTLASTFGCLAPTGGSNTTTPVNSMEVLTPAGDLQCSGTTPDTNHVDGHSNTLGTNTQLGSLPYSFTTTPDLPASNYRSSGPMQEQAYQPLDVGNGDGSDGENPGRIYNGTWVHTSIDVSNIARYNQMVNGNGDPNTATAFGAYWKVLYRVGGAGHDATVWSLSVTGSTVHLVNP